MSGDVVTSYTVYGLIASAAFQQCTEVADYVNKTYPESFAVSIQHEVPRDFDERRARWLSEGRISLDKDDLPCHVWVLNAATDTLMTANEFLALVTSTTHYRADPSAARPGNPDSYSVRAQQGWLNFLASRDRQYCWMDVTIDGAAVGRVWFELFSAVAPLTCRNFCALCRGVEMGMTMPGAAAADQHATAKTLITYKGTSFFRVLKGAWVMAGDVSSGHGGNGGYSCFGRTFPDETFAVPHDAAGVLGMCNDGPHTNASSFYITRRPMSWMNNKYVAFGRVMDGMSVVDAVHEVDVKHNQSPRTKVIIADCGVLDPFE